MEENKGTGRVIKGGCCVDLLCVAMQAAICSVLTNGDFSLNPGRGSLKFYSS